MTRRFLAYSLSHQLPVKVVWMEEEKMVSRNLTVIALRETDFDYLSARNKKVPRTMQMDDVLSCSYARGDSGDTLKNLERKNQQP